MSLNAGNIYIYENRFRIRFHKPGTDNTFEDNATVECVMMLVAKPLKRPENMYKCEVVTGSYKEPGGTIYYRIPNYALPKETIMAKGKPPLTFNQGQQMSDEAIHTYNKSAGDLILQESDFGGVGFRRGRFLERAFDKSKAEKRRYRTIFRAEEHPSENEPVGEEPDE